MTNQDKARIKQLVRETFTEFEDVPDRDMTPSLIRDWAYENLDHRAIVATAITISGRGFWSRVEKLCNLYKHLRYWRNLA